MCPENKHKQDLLGNLKTVMRKFINRHLFLLKMPLLLTMAPVTAQGSSSPTLDELLAQVSTCSGSIHATDEMIWLSRQIDPANNPTSLPTSQFTGLSLVNGNEITLRSNSIIRDFATSDEDIFILTDAGVEVWSQSTFERTRVIPTHQGSLAQIKYRQNPQAMAIIDHTVYIAHGRLGLTAVNLKDGSVLGEWPDITQQGHHESQAVDLVALGDLLIIGLDNFTMTPLGASSFRGFVVFDTKSHQVIHRADGLDPGLSALTLVDKHLLVSYDGPTWAYRVEDILQQEHPKPVRITWRYTKPGHPHGKPAVIQNNLLTCFHQDDTQGLSLITIPLTMLHP